MPLMIAMRAMSIVSDSIAAPTIRALQRALHRWYLANHRDLPWRRTRDPYAIWVSEVMLQQTQVKTVLPYYKRFLFQFPTVRHLADAPLQTVLKHWEGLGYYSRARNLRRAAGMVASEMKGQIPRDWQTIRRLPGVGDYIAAAVLSIAFGQPYAVVDGNVKRVLARLFLIDTPVNQASAHRQFQTAAQQLLPDQAPGDHNQAVMELGALVCAPRKPACDRCPLTRYCRAAATRQTDRYPRRVKKATTPEHLVVSAVIVKNGRLLLTRRPTEGLLGGLWEFPGGRSDPTEDLMAMCAGIVRSVTGLEVKVLGRITSVRHAYSHFKIRMPVFHCRWQSGRVRLCGPEAFRWVHPDRVADFPLHGAARKILPHLDRRMLQTS